MINGLKSTFYSCNIATNLQNENNVNVPEEVKTCYQFSNYLLNPNQCHYQCILRIMAIVFRYMYNLKCSVKKKRMLSYDKDGLKCLVITNEEILKA